jgi:hypothetical protein
MVQRHFLALAKEHEELVRQLSRHRKMLTEISKLCDDKNKPGTTSMKQYAEHVLKETPVRTVSGLREIDWKTLTT